MDNIFHQGQLAVQKITGQEDLANMRIPMIDSCLHAQSQGFIEHQILAFLGTEDSNGALWLSLIVGERGFISVPSLHEIKFNLDKIHSPKEDIFFENIKTKPTVGLLFHDAARRARYRAWGRVNEKDGYLSFGIKMGYPSCPKHIQREHIEVSNTSTDLSPQYENGTMLGELEKAWILNAHTFFISTQTPNGDVESSHRGGDPGFIEILDNGTIRVPDYHGNSMFSTLGNLYENPKAALLFIDYEKGKTLQLSGLAELQFEQNSKEDFYQSGETGRFWTFQTKQWVKTTNHHKVNTNFIDFSPYNILQKD